MVHIVGVAVHANDIPIDPAEGAEEGAKITVYVSIYNPEYPDKRRGMTVRLQTEGLSTGNFGSVIKRYSSPWPGEDVPMIHPMWAEDIVDHIELWDNRGFLADTASVTIRLKRLPPPPPEIIVILDRDRTATLKYEKV